VHNLSQAISAYATPSAAIQTERGTELQAFETATRHMCQADKTGDFAALSAALHGNRKLWTTLAIDVANMENQLPKELRAQIFYLAEFVDTHTSRVLAGHANASILHEVNQSIMRGLRGAGTPQ